MPRARSSAKNNSTANLGFEAKLWLAMSEVRKQNDEGRLVLILPFSFLLQTFSVLANPPFNDSDTAPRGGALLQNRANPQVVREAQDNFRKNDDVRWQWSEATWTGSPEGAHSSAHQYGVPPRGNANFAWVQHFIHHLAPQGMAGFVLVRFWFWVKLKAARVIKGLDNSTSLSFRERQGETLFVNANNGGAYLHSLN